MKQCVTTKKDTHCSPRIESDLRLLEVGTVYILLIIYKMCNNVLSALLTESHHTSLQYVVAIMLPTSRDASPKRPTKSRCFYRLPHGRTFYLQVPAFSGTVHTFHGNLHATTPCRETLGDFVEVSLCYAEVVHSTMVITSICWHSVRISPCSSSKVSPRP